MKVVLNCELLLYVSDEDSVVHNEGDILIILDCFLTPSPALFGTKTETILQVGDILQYLGNFISIMALWLRDSPSIQMNSNYFWKLGLTNLALISI